MAIEEPEFRFDHRTDLTCFGGVRPWLRKDEEWPRCGHCSQPLQFFFQIDFRHLPPQAARQYAGGGMHHHSQPLSCLCFSDWLILSDHLL